MFRALFANLRTHGVRLAMTALAVALGTGLMCGSFVFTASLTHSLDSLFAKSTAGTVGGRAVLLGRNGKPLPAQFVVATSWPADPPFQAIFTGRTGRPPAGPGQVMIDRASARRGHFTVGETIGIAIAGHAVPFTITGITGYGSADSIGGGLMAIFSLGTAQQLFGKTGEFDRIVVKAAPGVSATQLRDRIAPVLPAGDEAVTAASASASAAQQINRQLGILRDFFLGFAGIALFVGAFVIWNTFSIMIGQRTRELALTRALGASAGQVFRSVLAEAAIIAAVASAAGAGLGLGLARGLAALLSAFGLSLPISGLVLPAAELAVAIGTGIAITVIASLAPAYRATRVAPVQAMRDPAPEPTRFPAGRLISGLAVTTVGLAALLGGVLGGGGIVLTGAGAAGCFIGVTVLAPLVVRPLAYLASAPLIRLPGRVGLLARGNTMRNPKRTSATAAALMIGLAVIVGTSVLVSSARAEIAQQVSAASRSDFYVQATNSASGITPALAGIIARQPGVRAVTEVRATNATVAGAANRNVEGVDPAVIGQFTDLGVTAGQVSALGTPSIPGSAPSRPGAGTIMVSSAAAASGGWKVGDTVQVQFGSYGVYRLRIAAIFANIGPLSDYLVSNATL